MAFQVAQDGDLRYRLMGELDLATAGELYRQLAPVVREGRDLRVDASALTFIDIAGLRTLAALSDGCMNGGRILLERPTAPVKRLLVLVGAERFPNVVVRAASRIRRPSADRSARQGPHVVMPERPETYPECGRVARSVRLDHLNQPAFGARSISGVGKKSGSPG